MPSTSNTNKFNEAQKKIDHFLTEKLSEEEKELFWDWLFENPSYYDQLVFTATLKSKIKELEYSKEEVENNSVKSPTINTLNSYKWWGIAAAAIILFVFGINQFRVTSPVDSNILVFQDSLTYITSIDIFKMESIEALRSDEPFEDDELTGYLDLALMRAFLNEQQEALQLYLQSIKDFPDDPRTEISYMNAGILYYNLRMYSESAEILLELTEISVDNLRIQKAWWYRANALLFLGETEEARESFYMAYGYEGPYKNEALRQVRILDSYLYENSFEDISPLELDPQ